MHNHALAFAGDGTEFGPGLRANAGECTLEGTSGPETVSLGPPSGA